MDRGITKIKPGVKLGSKQTEATYLGRKKYLATPEGRENILRFQRASKTPDAILKMKESKRKYAATPEGRKVILAAAKLGSLAQRKPEAREKRRRIALANWRKPEFIKHWQDGQNRKPSNLELMLGAILEQYFPGQWRYTGDFNFWIGRKNPDFKRNGHKQIIELFGDYWHRGEKPDELVQYYRQHGFDCLVIWEHELEQAIEIIRGMMKT